MAEEFFKRLRNKTTIENEKATNSMQLSMIKHKQGEYQEAVMLIEESINTYEIMFLENHPELAMPYDNIGLVYEEIND
ncbi:hypothetical protein I4U23_026038 [Adineta vaga]|nr:hypothetical protein I4U23_026038 [Adineta vaga]